MRLNYAQIIDGRMTFDLENAWKSINIIFPASAFNGFKSSFAHANMKLELKLYFFWEDIKYVTFKIVFINWDKYIR
jgi:hypothetical protein